MATSPVLTYSMYYSVWDPITKREEQIPLSVGGTVHRSFSEHFNSIHITFNSNISLNKYEVRATEIPADKDPLVQKQSYGVGEGTLLFNEYGSIQAGVDFTFTISINGKVFDPTKSYRIGLYARSALDNTWDATELFMTTSGLFLVKPDGTWFETLAQDNI